VEEIQGVGDQSVGTFLSQEEVGEIEEEVRVVVEGEEVLLGVEVILKTETEETAIQTIITVM
jgi:hypothetical protein